jgi:hypothetical protein
LYFFVFTFTNHAFSKEEIHLLTFDELGDNENEEEKCIASTQKSDEMRILERDQEKLQDKMQELKGKFDEEIEERARLFEKKVVNLREYHNYERFRVEAHSKDSFHKLKNKEEQSFEFKKSKTLSK